VLAPLLSGRSAVREKAALSVESLPYIVAFGGRQQRMVELATSRGQLPRSGVVPRYARRDRFNHRDPLSKYGRSGVPPLGWCDTEKAAKTGEHA
jgi:hypothetical protein